MRASKDIARALENALLLNAWAGLFVSCDQRFFDPIIYIAGRETADHLARRRTLQHQAAEGRTLCRGMAGGDAGVVTGRRT